MITYQINTPITHEDFHRLLVNSSLGERRPIEDETCIKGMLENSNLIVSAWLEQQLVGIARSVTDFHYACYLSDLAVAETFQRQGIGKQLLQTTTEQLSPRCKLILIAAPNANDYYPKLGFSHNDRCWVRQPDNPKTP